MGAELSDLVPLEDVVLSHPVELVGRIVSRLLHLRTEEEIRRELRGARFRIANSPDRSIGPAES